MRRLAIETTESDDEVAETLRMLLTKRVAAAQQGKVTDKTFRQITKETLKASRKS